MSSQRASARCQRTRRPRELSTHAMATETETRLVHLHLAASSVGRVAAMAQDDNASCDTVWCALLHEIMYILVPLFSAESPLGSIGNGTQHLMLVLQEFPVLKLLKYKHPPATPPSATLEVHAADLRIRVRSRCYLICPYVSVRILKALARRKNLYVPEDIYVGDVVCRSSRAFIGAYSPQLDAPERFGIAHCLARLLRCHSWVGRERAAPLQQLPQHQPALLFPVGDGLRKWGRVQRLLAARSVSAYLVDMGMPEDLVGPVVHQYVVHNDLLHARALVSQLFLDQCRPLDQDTDNDDLFALHPHVVDACELRTRLARHLQPKETLPAVLFLAPYLPRCAYTQLCDLVLRGKVLGYADDHEYIVVPPL